MSGLPGSLFQPSTYLHTKGCAITRTAFLLQMTTTYVSPLQYQSYSCDQLALEMNRVSRKVNELRGDLKEEADNDAAQMAIGLVIFWPALFFLEGGDGADAQEFSRLKGEFEALEQMSIQKQCGIQVQQS